MASQQLCICALFLYCTVSFSGNTGKDSTSKLTQSDRSEAGSHRSARSPCLLVPRFHEHR